MTGAGVRTSEADPGFVENETQRFLETVGGHACRPYGYLTVTQKSLIMSGDPVLKVRHIVAH